MATAAVESRKTDKLLSLARELAAVGGNACGSGSVAAESVRLARKVLLLIHLLEEIRDFAARNGGDGESTLSPDSPWSCISQLALSLDTARRFMLLQRRHDSGESSVGDLVNKNIAIQYQYVTWLLEKVLGNISYDFFKISNEVQEEVQLVRAQLRRETKKGAVVNLNIFQEVYRIFSSARVKTLKRQSLFKLEAVEEFEHIRNIDPDLGNIIILIAKVSGKSIYDAKRMTPNLMEKLKNAAHSDVKLSNTVEPDSLVIPEDFRCPISLELMRDPVIVSTGQRWIDCGNRTCPKTQQKLQHLTLTPNYVLRSLIMQFCEVHGIDKAPKSTSGRTRTDGSFQEISGDRSSMETLVSKLTSRSTDEQRSAAGKIRLLAKRSMENRILIAESGAIPHLICLLHVNDQKTQEHAVTSLLNLSIYDQNKQTIILSGAISSITHVLRNGSMEARENAAATIYSLSLIDENKITIGGTPGAIKALVELLEKGSSRGKKDAATALFNLCICQGNKPRAIKAGILKPLVEMLKDSSANMMLDEALSILALIVSHQDGREAMKKLNMIPVLIDFLRAGQARNKENAAAVLLALCKKDSESLARIGRLGAVIPLTEVANNGTERAKRKANSLLEQLHNLKIL
ncbi:U-box domain-containing protein 10 [Apostasia shenzhenica]|uniref:RING-type E3 ubiquitin transferase n=1 Tax=Apostasia shenzhenica TaxID=1088818 RepID=A0A2I0AZR2_9ASPA|nr:U-box domain-containing protein 10 [Apostasia shenzhenica]